MRLRGRRLMEKRNYKRISQDGDFDLYAAYVLYRTYRTTDGYIRNRKTGENCGTEVELYRRYYRDNIPLDKPEYDEDCYEIVERVD